MPRPSTSFVPKYRKHRGSGQAIVTLCGVDHYLGPHGTRVSHSEYDWQSNPRTEERFEKRPPPTFKKQQLRSCPLQDIPWLFNVESNYMAVRSTVHGANMLPQQTTSWYEISMNDIGAAVIGAGFIGKIHVEALKRLGVPVIGVLGSNPEKSELLRQELALGKAYQQYAEVLADESVQVVHLAVPNVLHFDLAQQALQAGKHVMCEKPLAMNAEETSQLVALAKETGLAAGVCFNTRFYPLNFEANSIVHRGDLGKVFSIVGSYQQDWLLYETDYNWRVLAEHSGPMRVVADIGSHWIVLVCFITGLKVEAVCADLQTIHPVRKRPVGEVETFAGKQASDQKYEDITHEDLILMRKHSPKNVQVKAAGGVRTLDALLAVRELGVTRAGATRTAEMLDECKKRLVA